MRVQIKGIDSIGVIRDQAPWLLPAQAWTQANNVSFLNGAVKKARQYDLLLTAPITANFLMQLKSGKLLLANNSAVYKYDGVSATDISKVGGYTGTSANQWFGDIFNGIPLINNGKDVPQTWVGQTGNLADLVNWPAGVTAKVIRPFKNFLVALNVTKAGTKYGRMVKWSHPAAAGSLPATWDETNASYDAGEVVLAEGEDDLVDQVQYSGINLLYTGTQTWAMRYIGGQSVFSFDRVFGDVGLLSANCARSFQGRHFVVTQDDIVQHDLNQVQSIIDSRARNFLFSDINLISSGLKYACLIPNYYNKELWFCYPGPSSSYVNKVAVWKSTTGTWSFLTLPNSFGMVQSLSGISGYYPSKETLVFSAVSGAGINVFNPSNHGGVQWLSSFTRECLPLAGATEAGEPVLNPTSMKLYRELELHFEGQNLPQFDVYFTAVQDPYSRPQDSVAGWKKVTFTPGTNNNIIPVNLTGRALSFYVLEKAGTNMYQDWELSNIVVDVEETSIL